MIENAKITSVSISMADHGCLTFTIYIEGDGWFCSFGNRVAGHGCLDSNYWDATGSSLVAIMKILDTVGVETWESLEGSYIRVESNGWGGKVKKIGHIIRDKWFDIDEFFEQIKDEKPFILDERKKDEEQLCQNKEE